MGLTKEGWELIRRRENGENIYRMTEEEKEAEMTRLFGSPPTRFPGSYYTKEQVAEIRGVTLRTVQQWIEKGWLQSIYFGGAHHIEATQLEGFNPPKPGPRP